MILVTGATGNVGTQVISGLNRLGRPHRALSRNPPDMQAATQWFHGGFEDDTVLRDAMRGVDTVVLISPAHPDMVAHQTAVVNAAIDAGITRLVKLSGLGAAIDAAARLPNCHGRIEHSIMRSGIPYTMVRPNLFMQVLLGARDSIVAAREIYAPAGGAHISLTDARDVADVIVAAATQDGHEFQIYDMSGPEALSYADAAARIGRSVGREVRFVNVSEGQARDSMLSSGMDPWLVEAFLELFAIYRAGHGSSVHSDAIATVAGHPARSFEGFLAEFGRLVAQAA